MSDEDFTVPAPKPRLWIGTGKSGPQLAAEMKELEAQGESFWDRVRPLRGLVPIVEEHDEADLLWPPLPNYCVELGIRNETARAWLARWEEDGGHTGCRR